MEILLTPEQWVLDLYPEFENENNYKLSNYIIKTEINDKIVFIHTITWSIYALDKIEFDNILTNETMIINKIVIPNYFNEDILAHEVYLKRMTPKQLPTFEKIYGCVILTTTACNARCAYCYENNITKKEVMTLKTAEDIVQYLAEKHHGIKSPLEIQWFGGEPLLNQTVIDYMVNRFNELDIPFSSKMISNGFLFNDETIEKLDKWKLKHVQITFDGIFDDYNQGKNYVYTDIDAFLTVLNNVHNILDKTNTKVIIRINISNENIFKIYDAIEFLKDEFKNNIDKNLSIYIAPIFQIRNEAENAIDGFWDEIERLKQIVNMPNISKCDIELNEETFKRKQINKNCMSFNGGSLVILPNGNLAPCEHINDEDIYGNIYDGITNIDVVKKWYTFDSHLLSFCKNNKCPLQPICPRFFNCDEHLLCYKEQTKKDRLSKAEQKLIRTYNFWNNIQNN